MRLYTGVFQRSLPDVALGGCSLGGPFRRRSKLADHARHSVADAPASPPEIMRSASARPGRNHRDARTSAELKAVRGAGIAFADRCPICDQPPVVDTPEQLFQSAAGGDGAANDQPRRSSIPANPASIRALVVQRRTSALRL